jgi:ParB/RepB/Spo0J family partition protein
VTVLEEFARRGRDAQAAADHVIAEHTKGDSVSTQPTDVAQAERRTQAAAAAAVTAAGDEYFNVPLSAIVPSPTNPRKHFDQTSLEELAGSIRTHGILEPLLVRTNRTVGKGLLPRYELVAGERRLRAAKIAGVDQVPVRVKVLTDKEALEIQVVENLQRDGLSALEESTGYQQLHDLHGYTVEQIADKIGKSKAYVYARLKLDGLTPASEKLLAAGEISPGHAILLARLKPADQARVAEQYLFEDEDVLKDPDSKVSRRADDPRKPISVRELEARIAEHVRFDAKAVDPMVHPRTAEVLIAAEAEGMKVVPITHDHYVPPEAKDGNRTYGPQSWKRADGLRGSKACDFAVAGFIAVGEGYGQAFKVCINKEKCARHWGAEMKARAKRAAKGGRSTGSAQKRENTREAQDLRWQQQQEREQRAQKRWEAARSAIFKDVAAAVAKAPARAGGNLAEVIIRELVDEYGRAAVIKEADSYLPRGATAEDLVRYAAFLALFKESFRSYGAAERYTKLLAPLGVDVKKHLAAAVPADGEAAAPKKKVKRG